MLTATPHTIQMIGITRYLPAGIGTTIFGSVVCQHAEGGNP